MARDQSIRRGERGVSQVIGVVLIVAITVILVGVVATFVLGFGDADTSPTPNFADDTSFDDRTSGYGQYLNITHDGGEALDPEEVHLAVDGAKVVDTASGSATDAQLDSDVFTTGRVGSQFVATDTFVVDQRAFSVASDEHLDLSDATVRLVHYPGGDAESSVVYECDVAYPDCANK